MEGGRGAGRVSGQRRVAFRQWQPAGHLDGRALPGDRNGRVASAEPLWPSNDADAAVPKEQARPIEDWDTIGMRGTASEGYRVNDVFVPEAYSGTREDPSLRRDPGPLYAFTMQGLYAVGVAGGRVRDRPRHAG